MSVICWKISRYIKNSKHKLGINLWQWLGVLFCLFFAFIIRIIPYRVVITDTGIKFFAQDPYYHARRVLLGYHNNWIIPTYDSYSGFPEGLYCFWSDLFNYSILWLALLWGKGQPTIHQIELVSAFAPVIWAILSFIPFYLIVRKLFNHKIALLTLLILAILPGHIYQTLLGRADHFSADSIFPLYQYLFLLLGLESGDINQRRYYGFLAGLCMTLSWLIWPGSTIFIGIAIFYLILFSIIEYNHSLSFHSTAGFASWVCLISLLSLFPFSATSHWGRNALISYDAISWFQWILILFFMIYFFLLFLMERYLKYRKYALKFYIFGIIFITIFSLGIIWLYLPKLSHSFLQGLGWIGKTDPWLQTITEFQPLFISMGVFSTFRANTYFSYGIYLIPLIYLILFFIWFKNKIFSAGSIWLIIFSISIMILGLNQSRFSHFLAFIIALGLALFFYTFWEKRYLFLDYFKAPTQIKDLTAALLVIILLYVIFQPAFREIRAIEGKYPLIPPVWKSALLWLKDNTPPTSYLYHPFRQPEYGILAPWIAGHWINYIAQRPTLANGFHTNRENNIASMKFFLSNNVAEAKSIIEDRKIRYIILTDMTPNLQEYARIIGRDENYIFKTIYYPPEGGVQITFSPTKKYYELISTQLYLYDGNYLTTCSTGIFRLIYESEETWLVNGNQVNVLKIFQYVQGAVIHGIAQPNVDINVRVPIITNTGREFEYRFHTQVDSNGFYQFILPYSQTNSSYPVIPTGPYQIQIGSKYYQLNVDERIVREGRSIILTK